MVVLFSLFHVVDFYSVTLPLVCFFVLSVVGVQWFDSVYPAVVCCTPMPAFAFGVVGCDQLHLVLRVFVALCLGGLVLGGDQRRLVPRALLRRCFGQM